MFEFNGQTRDYIHSMQVIGNHYGPARVLERESISGRNGTLLRRATNDEKVFPLEITIMPQNGETLQEIADDMVAWLYQDEVKRLELPDNPGRFYDVMLEGGIDRDEIEYFAQCTLTFVSFDGVAYSSALYTNTAISDVVDVVNEGTAKTDMIVEARALENSTMYMITKGDDDYFMLGRPTDAFQGEADTTPTVWLARSNTFQAFTKRTEDAYVGDQNLTGQRVTGSIGLMGNRLEANYGTTDRNDVWHGPVYRRSLDNLVDDFHTRCGFQINQVNSHGVGKSFIHLYDESGNIVLSYGLIDAQNRGRSVRAVVRLYTTDGGYEEIYNSTGWRYDTVYADRYIWISVDRIGDRWTVKTWHNYTENGIRKVTGRANISYTDGEGLFDRDIAMGEIAMARHSRYPAADQHISWARIEDQLELENVVPHLIKAGDQIVIDTNQSLVMLNDEPITEEKDFGSNYFQIDKGLNTLLIEPQGRFDTTVKWHDRYL